MNCVNKYSRPSSRSPWIPAGGSYKGADGSGLPPSLLRLDSNEGSPFGSTIRILSDADAVAELSSRYDALSSFEREIALRWGVEPERVVCTAGGDDAIMRVCSARLAPGSKSLVYDPAFAMFAIYARNRGASSFGLPWYPGEEFPIESSEDMIARMPSLGLVCLASPANPSGSSVDSESLERMVAACDRYGTALLFDAVYGEFADKDPSSRLVENRAAFVVRSFSKAYGLAGMRVGYVIAPDVVEASRLRAAGAPYPTSALAATLALAALQDEEERDARLREILDEREAISRVLRSLGAVPYRSQGNFVTAAVRDPFLCKKALEGEGVLVRALPACADFGYLRITCPGSSRDSARLLSALARLDREGFQLPSSSLGMAESIPVAAREIRV